MSSNIDSQGKHLRDRHAIFCALVDYALKGSRAERQTIQYLLDHLPMEIAGDYRLLINYNVMERGGNSLEVDIVVINRWGVFLLEVKGWRGVIEGHDDAWIFHGKTGQQPRKNAWRSIDYKSKVLYSQLFEKSGKFPDLRSVSVVGLVVLTQGTQYYLRYGHDKTQSIVDLSDSLVCALTSFTLLHSGNRSRRLSDTEIQMISQTLHEKHVSHDIIVHDYRIERELSFGDLCDVFEAQHIRFNARRGRLKRYQLTSLDENKMEIDIRKFQRSAEAVFALGEHAHILATREFFADDVRQEQDVFYEITDLPTGPGLENVMHIKAQQNREMPLSQQLDFLVPICQALQHAHNHRDARDKPDPIYHRNICPETVFQMRDGTVKLGDFDFAKFGDETITVEDETLIEKPYTAPEVLQDSRQATARSDIYSLGVLWYFLACLPARPGTFDASRIDALKLPERAHALLKRMTARKENQRPGSIEEVQRELIAIKEDIK
jgi:serine/threonine protein kinase